MEQVSAIAADKVGLEGDDAAATVTDAPKDGEAEPRAASRSETDRQAREQDLFHRARAEDVLHWQEYHRPISAETLAKRLHVGSRKARKLVTRLRSDTRGTLDNQILGSQASKPSMAASTVEDPSD